MEPISAAITVLEVLTALTKATRELSHLLKTICRKYFEIEALERELRNFGEVISRVETSLNDHQVSQHIKQNPNLREDIRVLKGLFADCNSRIDETRFALQECINPKTGEVNGWKWYFTKTMRSTVTNIKEELRDCRERVNTAFSAFHYMETLRQRAGSPKASVADLLFTYAPQREALIQAAREGDSAKTEILLLAGVPVDWRNSEGRTPLSIAAEVGNVSVVKLLIQNNANVNTVADELPGSYKHRGRRTPLHWAAARGHKDIVTILLDAGADMEIRRHGNTPPIYEACKNNHVAIVTLMLDRGADVNICARMQGTILHEAVYEGRLNMVKLLVKRKADVEAEYMGRFILPGYGSAGKETTPIFFAAFPGKNVSKGRKLKIMQLLLSQGKAKADVVDSAGATPLHYAVRAGWLEGVKELLGRKAYAAKKDSSNTSPIDDAARLGHVECLKVLLQSLPKRTQAGEKDCIAALAQMSPRKDDVVKLLDAFFNPKPKSVKSDSSGAKQDGAKEDKAKQPPAEEAGVKPKVKNVQVDDGKQGRVNGEDPQPKKKAAQEDNKTKQDTVQGDKVKQKALKEKDPNAHGGKPKSVTQGSAKVEHAKEACEKKAALRKGSTQHGDAKKGSVKSVAMADQTKTGVVKASKVKQEKQNSDAPEENSKKEVASQNDQKSEAASRRQPKPSSSKQSEAGAKSTALQTDARHECLRTSKAKQSDAQSESKKAHGVKQKVAKGTGMKNDDVKAGGAGSSRVKQSQAHGASTKEGDSKQSSVKSGGERDGELKSDTVKQKEVGSKGVGVMKEGDKHGIAKQHASTRVSASRR